MLCIPIRTANLANKRPQNLNLVQTDKRLIIRGVFALPAVLIFLLLLTPSVSAQTSTTNANETSNNTAACSTGVSYCSAAFT